MPLQISGQISLANIQTEFGGTAPTALSEYYAAATGIPATGEISIGDFYGASAAPPEDPPGPNAWTLTSVDPLYLPYSKLQVGSYDSIPTHLHFTNDGLKLYFVGVGLDKIICLQMTSAYDISSATFHSQLLVGAQETNPTCLWVHPQGLFVVVVGTTGDDLNEYLMSTPFDLSTATFNYVHSIKATNGVPRSMFWNSTGTKMWFTDGANIEEYNFSNYDIGNVTFGAVISQVGSNQTSPNQLFWKSDGTKFWMIGTQPDQITEYVPNNPGTIVNNITNTGNIIDLSSVDTNPTGMWITNDGTKLFVVGSALDAIVTYILPTPFSLAGAYLDLPSSHYAIAPNLNTTGVWWNQTGTKLYTIGTSDDTLYQYDVSTAFDPATLNSTASGSHSVSIFEGNPQDIFWKEDGTKFWVIGSTSDQVHEFTPPTPFVPTGAVRSQVFPQQTSSGEANPQTVAWDPDGTRLFILGLTLDAVRMFNITGAPYNMGSAVYNTTEAISVASFDLSPKSLRFKPDGTKMFVLGASGSKVGEWTLSTPWSLNSATLTRTYILPAQSAPQGMHIRDNGKLMTIINNRREIMVYNLDT